jgi:hypothetical protein
MPGTWRRGWPRAAGRKVVGLLEDEPPAFHDPVGEDFLRASVDLFARAAQQQADVRAAVDFDIRPHGLSQRAVIDWKPRAERSHVHFFVDHREVPRRVAAEVHGVRARARQGVPSAMNWQDHLAVHPGRDHLDRIVGQAAAGRGEGLDPDPPGQGAVANLHRAVDERHQPHRVRGVFDHVGKEIDPTKLDRNGHRPVETHENVVHAELDARNRDLGRLGGNGLVTGKTLLDERVVQRVVYVEIPKFVLVRTGQDRRDVRHLAVAEVYRTAEIGRVVCVLKIDVEVELLGPPGGEIADAAEEVGAVVHELELDFYGHPRVAVVVAVAYTLGIKSRVENDHARVDAETHWHADGLTGMVGVPDTFLLLVGNHGGIVGEDAGHIKRPQDPRAKQRNLWRPRQPIGHPRVLTAEDSTVPAQAPASCSFVGSAWARLTTTHCPLTQRHIMTRGITHTTWLLLPSGSR